MRITFEFSAPNLSLGVKEPLRYQADTSHVAEDIAAKLEQLVAASGLLSDKPPADAALGRGTHPELVRDATEYELIIQGDGVQRSFSWNDTTVPASVWPLLRYLKQLAIERRMASG